MHMQKRDLSPLRKNELKVLVCFVANLNSFQKRHYCNTVNMHISFFKANTFHLGRGKAGGMGKK